ncbi:MAG TPA: hypothetical protein VFB32_16745 [Rudaea sp.]|nr:hypothetical protein [Rudaea sp.]
MQRGDFATAWRISDRVLAERQRLGVVEHAPPRHLQQVWNGQPLGGRRVLVHCYHGLGDTLQFVRLLPLLRERAAHVTLWVQPALIGLLHEVDGCDRLEALHDGEPAIERDADVELMELAHILRLDAAHVPARVPYLRLGVRARPRRSRVRRIGIAWQAGEWDPARSIPATDLAALADASHVRWCSLQFPPVRAPFAMSQLACRDLVEQARRMCGLDLVISVDTMVAHLAGALGLPVWLLLPSPCDWRWMCGRDDSQWYPTMRIFRQPRRGDWRSVIERVRTALAHASAQRTQRACA